MSDSHHPDYWDDHAEYLGQVNNIEVWKRQDSIAGTMYELFSPEYDATFSFHEDDLPKLLLLLDE